MTNLMKTITTIIILTAAFFANQANADSTLKYDEFKHSTVCVSFEDGSGYCDIRGNDSTKLSFNNTNAFYVATNHKVSGFPAFLTSGKPALSYTSSKGMLGCYVEEQSNLYKKIANHYATKNLHKSRSFYFFWDENQNCKGIL